MKTLIFSAFILISVFPASAQQAYDPSRVNKKAVALYNQAIERAQDGNLTLATGLLQKAIETDPKFLDAYLSIAGVYSQLKLRKSSADYYEKAFAIDAAYTRDFKLPYSVQLAGLGQFDKALAAVNELLATNPKNPNTVKACNLRKRCYEFGVDYARQHPDSGYVFAPQNLGSMINSPESEYFPSLSIDGKELVFTRRVGEMNEDFYYSRLQASGEWSQAKPMEGDVNTRMNEAAQNISQDQDWMVFTANGRPDSYGDFDLYIAYKTPMGWSDASNLGGRVNSDQWDSQPCLSPDKKDLYFASRRQGGYGGSDIYVCHLQPNGKWGEPENLGPTINSPEDDQCPFIHADNQTLFFTSSYWPGYGDEDIFYVRKDADGKWGKPVNLGYPINTIDREGTLFIAADGKTAFYASDRADSKGGIDLYRFILRKDIRPARTLWVKGRVFDNKTKQGLPSSLELVELSTRKTVSTVQTKDDGSYLVTLPVGHDYGFLVNKKGYLFFSDHFLLAGDAPDTAFEKNIALLPIEVNATIVLNNVFFDVNKFNLKPESQAELDKLVQLLKDNPTLKIQISGHTDNAGKPADNLALSNNRSKAVVAYLVQKGIAATRLAARGFGETQPVADNKTEEGRAKNRRTEMKVLGQ